MKRTPLFHRFSPALFFLAALSLVLSLTATASTSKATDLKTIAVLPFTINSAEDMSHIQKGIIQMFYSRLSWRDHVVVIPNRDIKAQLSQMPSFTGDQLIGKIAARTNSHYVVAGSITNLAGSFSIDAQVYDIKNKRFMAFFEQSKINDDLIDKVDRIAATINKKAFNRSTVTSEKMEQEKQAHINKLKRQNPEHLMKAPQAPQDQGPGWKVWEYLF